MATRQNPCISVCQWQLSFLPFLLGTAACLPKADRHTAEGRGTEKHTQELWKAEERGSPGRGWQIPWPMVPMGWH